MDIWGRIKTVVWTRIDRCVFDGNENLYFWKRISVDRAQGCWYWPKQSIFSLINQSCYFHHSFRFHQLEQPIPPPHLPHLPVGRTRLICNYSTSVFYPEPTDECSEICITFVFHFSWALQPSQEELKTMLARNFGGQIRCIMGNAEVAYIYCYYYFFYISGSRIILGNNHVFRFNFPDQGRVQCTLQYIFRR